MLVLRKLKLITLDHASSPSGSVPVKELSPMRMPRRLFHLAIEFGRVPVNELLSTCLSSMQNACEQIAESGRVVSNTPSYLDELQLAPITDIFRQRTRKSIVRNVKLKKVPVYDG